jgi:tRNA(Ile)-lysidine synthase
MTIDPVIEKTIAFISKHQMIDPGRPVMLAVSGGLDSMVMLHIFAVSDIPVCVAHYNFQLRGEESVQDEKFVKDATDSLKLPFFSKSASCLSYAENKGISIQEAAREMRYNWLAEIALSNGYHRIATAHHLDDSIESFFINLLRGTGIFGLKGIPLINGPVIRPLLFLKRQEIYDFAIRNDLHWRDDSSNRSDKYLRNRIRTELLPVLNQMHDDFSIRMGKNFERLVGEASLLEQLISQFKKTHFEKTNQHTIIRWQNRHLANGNSALLYHCLKEYGFQFVQTQAILSADVGSLFISPEYELLVDRESFLVRKLSKAERKESFVVASLNESINTPEGMFSIREIDLASVKFNNQRSIEYIDLDQVEFPMLLRRWREGDIFYPLGLKGKKQKIQDLFTNYKLSRFQKEHQWILTSGDSIVWVVGIKLDSRYKIKNKTCRVAEVAFNPPDEF